MGIQMLIFQIKYNQIQRTMKESDQISIQRLINEKDESILIIKECSKEMKIKKIYLFSYQKKKLFEMKQTEQKEIKKVKALKQYFKSTNIEQKQLQFKLESELKDINSILKSDKQQKPFTLFEIFFIKLLRELKIGTFQYYQVEKWINLKKGTPVLVLLEKNKIRQVYQFQDIGGKMVLEKLQNSKEIEKRLEGYQIQSKVIKQKGYKSFKLDQNISEMEFSKINFNGSLLGESQLEDQQITKIERTILNKKQMSEFKQILFKKQDTLSDKKVSAKSKDYLQIMDNIMSEIIKDVNSIKQIPPSKVKQNKISIQVRNQKLNSLPSFLKSQTLSHWFIYIQYDTNGLRIDLHQGQHQNDGRITLDLKVLSRKKIGKNKQLYDEFKQMQESSNPLNKYQGTVQKNYEEILQLLMEFIHCTNKIKPKYSLVINSHNCQDYSKMILQLCQGTKTLDQAKQWVKSHQPNN